MGTYFNIINGDDPIFVILTGNKFALKHVSLMHMCNKTQTTADLFQLGSIAKTLQPKQ